MMVDWKWQLAATIAQNFRCDIYTDDTRELVRQPKPPHRRVYVRRRGVRLIGLVDDVTVARDVYSSARDVAERLSRAYTQDRDNLAQYLEDKYGSRRLDLYAATTKAVASRELRLAWIGGFLTGIEAKFATQLQENPSLALMLVVHPVVQDAVKALNLSTIRWSRPHYERSDEARDAGYRAGREFEHEPTRRVSAGTTRLPGGALTKEEEDGLCRPAQAAQGACPR